MVGQLQHVDAMTELERIKSTALGAFPGLEIPSPTKAPEGAPETFSDLLAEAVSKIEELKGESDLATIELALGRPVELHQVMLSSAKAQIALELFIELRNKLIEAYQEINRMPM